MKSIISDCGTYRYRLDRDVSMFGIVIAYFGINCSTADGDSDDQSVRKWIGFTKLNGGSRFIVGNPFAYRSKDVKKLATCKDPVGPSNEKYLNEIIEEADILVACWGNRIKAPKALHKHFDSLERKLFSSGKPVKVFGLTKSGDPLHPMMLGYSTPLVPWVKSTN